MLLDDGVILGSTPRGRPSVPGARPRLAIRGAAPGERRDLPPPGSPAPTRAQKLAISKLRDRGRSTKRRPFPWHVTRCRSSRGSATFLYRGDADEGVGASPCRRPADPLPTTADRLLEPLGATCDPPTGSRVEYQLRNAPGRPLRALDPLNPRLAASPLGSSSVCAAIGMPCQVGAPRFGGPRGELVSEVVGPRRCAATRRSCSTSPPDSAERLATRSSSSHDGTDYLGYTAMKTVLDNLIHRLDIAPMIVTPSVRP